MINSGLGQNSVILKKEVAELVIYVSSSNYNRIGGKTKFLIIGQHYPSIK